MSITKKIVALVILVTVVLMVSLTAFLNLTLSKDMEKNIVSRMEAQVETILEFMESTREETQKRVKTSLSFTKAVLYSKPLSLSKKSFLMEAENEDTHKSQIVRLQEWDWGDAVFQKSFGFIDRIKVGMEGTVTVFQKTEPGFVRINSNLIKSDGSSAVGSFIPNDALVAQRLSQGKSYVGRSFIAGDWYLSAYEPILIAGKVAGILSVAIREKNIKSLKEAFAAMKFEGDGFAFVLDEEGRFIIHPKLLGRQINESYPAYEQILQKKNGVSRYYASEYKEEMVAVYREYKPFGWVIGAAVSTTRVINQASSTLKTITFSAIIVGGLFYIMLLSLFIRFLMKPVRRTVEILKDLAGGQGDLSVRLPERGRDEMAQLSYFFNRFVEKLVGIVMSVKNQMALLAEVGANLNQTMNGTANAVDEINRGVASTEEEIESQSVNVAQTSVAIEEMARSIDNLNNAIQDQTVSLNESSAAIEEMVANVVAISENTDAAGDLITQLKEVSDIGKHRMELVDMQIDQIEEGATHMVDANKMISGIAAQTNLLAMNASIEAAHAGDAGRGFSVVAKEIRSLAEMASQQSKAVQENIKAVKSSIDDVVVSSKEGKKAFNDIWEVVENVSRIVEEVKQALQEQNEGSTHILEALSRMNETAEVVFTGSKEMSQGNAQILNTVNRLNQISANVQASMKQIVGQTQTIKLGITQVTQLSQENNNYVQRVEGEVGEFKLDSDLP